MNTDNTMIGNRKYSLTLSHDDDGEPWHVVTYSTPELDGWWIANRITGRMIYIGPVGSKRNHCVLAHERAQKKNRK